MAEEIRFGGYRMGSNIPFRKGAVWENVARVSRWGAPVIELNTSAERLGSTALEVIKQLAKANDLIYTWHIPPDARQSGELAVPNDAESNKLAQRVIEQTIRSASRVGARHITLHPTFAPKPADDQVYVYDEIQQQIVPKKIIDGLSKDETIELLNDSTVAQVESNYSNTESQYKLVKNLRRYAELVSKEAVDDNVFLMAALVKQLSSYNQRIQLQPDNIGEWQSIQLKAIKHEPLTSHEREVVKNYAKKMLKQLGNYEKLFNAQLKQLKPLVEKAKKGSLIKDGFEVMKDNVAKNIASIRKEYLDTAVKNKISLGFENLPGQFLFNSPEELLDLRKRVVDKLVSSGKMSREQAEEFVGFTFDTAHANITKEMDVSGRFVSPSEFVKKLGKHVKHLHLVDNVGVIDGHLPLGQGDISRDEFLKIKEALEKSGFKGTSIHELGASEIPQLYTSSAEWIEGGYFTSYGQPTSGVWGPSYLAAGMTDPLLLGNKDRGYFYESFVDIF